MIFNKFTKKKNRLYKTQKNTSKRFDKLKYDISFAAFKAKYKDDFKITKNGYKQTTIPDEVIQKLLKINTLNYEYCFEFMKRLLLILCSRINCKHTWIQIKKKYVKKCRMFLKNETDSTYYILNLIGNSFISNDKKIEIIYDNQELTGLWIDDSKHFSLSIDQFNSGKLIMGFGPSASGKTHWAKSIIKLLSKYTDMNFPTNFLSIDGGIQRETSFIYQIIKNMIKEYEGFGIKNLMSSSLTLPSIFSSNKIKKILKEYLKIQSLSGIHPNLYIPETLGGCSLTYDCSNKYKEYIKITNDTDWIGLYIWQHKDHCPLSEEYKCKTTIKSGSEREINEGKKYNPNAYSISEVHGNRQLFKDNRYKIRIHNSGGLIHHKSIIELDEELMLKIYNNKDYIEKEFNSVFIPFKTEFNNSNPVF